MSRINWVVVVLVACVSGMIGAVLSVQMRVLAGAPAQKVVKAGRFEVVDSRGKLRAMLSMMPDGRPVLSLHDKDGRIRAVLGATELEAIRTGESTKTAESSLVLFDKDGKVMWRAP